MVDLSRIFAVASDEALVSLISSAQTRLVIVAPALTKSVADALESRFDDLGGLDITVILDADPEVYRLGFGDQEALEAIRIASNHAHFDLREQPGVRIGVVISDDTTIVYSPISKNIEAGSVSIEKPNAIILAGGAGNRIAAAAGANASDSPTISEIGKTALDPAKVREMQSNLKSNPPKPFDITRRMNIFTSRVQYVEFSVSNTQLTRKQIALPPELVDVADDDLKGRITAKVRAPFEDIGKLAIEIICDGKTEKIEVDEQLLSKKRKKIENTYTYQINNFGRVILQEDRKAFDKAVERFKTIIENYQTALQAKLKESKVAFVKRIVDEFTPRWERAIPPYFERWKIQATAQNIKTELERMADEIFSNAVSFDAPSRRYDWSRDNSGPTSSSDFPVSY